MATPPYPTAFANDQLLHHTENDDDDQQPLTAETSEPPLSVASSTLAQGLPRYFILKSYNTKKYLRHIGGTAKELPALQFSGPNTEKNPDTKFEFVVSTSDPELVHIRSCYNNKYWVMEDVPDKYYITAEAVKPEENRSLKTCTLFEPVAGNFPGTFLLRNVYTTKFTAMWPTGTRIRPCLHGFVSDWDHRHHWDLFKIFDWELFMLLSKHIVLKGNNKKYLQAYYDDEQNPLMSFAAGAITDDNVANEIVPGPDGTVRIKNNYFKAFWRVSNERHNWILVDTPVYKTHEKETLFEPVKLGKNIIALRSMANKMFVRRLSVSGHLANGLSASGTKIDSSSRLAVEEPVLRRTIGNVKFRFKDARIYGERSLSLISEEAVNRSSVAHTIDLSVKYSDTRSRSWSAGGSLTIGVSTKFSSKIPLIVDNTAEFSAEVTGTHEWGETKEWKTIIQEDQQMNVPATSRRKAEILGTQAYCDVPFSFTQDDVLLNGDPVSTEIDTGVYTVLNAYNFQYKVMPLPYSD